MIASLGLAGGAPATATATSSAMSYTTTRAIPAGRLLVIAMWASNGISAGTAGGYAGPSYDPNGINVWVTQPVVQITGISVQSAFAFITDPIPSGTVLQGVWQTGPNDQCIAAYEFAGVQKAATAPGNGGTNTAVATFSLGIGTALAGSKSALFWGVGGINLNAAMSGAAAPYSILSDVAFGTTHRAHFQAAIVTAYVGSEIFRASWTGSASYAALQGQIPLHVEDAHVGRTGNWTRRPSGIVVPRPAVYRASR